MSGPTAAGGRRSVATAAPIGAPCGDDQHVREHDRRGRSAPGRRQNHVGVRTGQVSGGEPRRVVHAHCDVTPRGKAIAVRELSLHEGCARRERNGNPLPEYRPGVGDSIARHIPRRKSRNGKDVGGEALARRHGSPDHDLSRRLGTR